MLDQARQARRRPAEAQAKRTARDRAEFEAFISNFLNEIVAVSNALAPNAEELEKARDTFHEIVTALLEVLIPVCLLVIAVIARQAFPVTVPYAEAVGFAGATITLATVALLNGQLLSALGAVITGLRGDSVTSSDQRAVTGVAGWLGQLVGLLVWFGFLVAFRYDMAVIRQRAGR